MNDQTDDFYQEADREVNTQSLSYKLNDDVVFMTSYMLDNLVGIEEDSIIILSPETDIARLPSVGKVLLLSSASDVIPSGFVGRINSIIPSNGKLKIITSSVGLYDLFSQFTCQVEANPADYEIYDEDDNIIPSEIISDEDDTDDEFVSDDESEPLSMSAYENKTRASGSASYSREFKVKISAFPHLTSEAVLRIGGMVKLDIDLLKEYVNLDAIISATAKVGVNATMGQSLGFDKTKKFIGRIMMHPIPSMPAITVPINLYTYELYDGKVELEGSVTAKHTTSANVLYDRGKVSGKLNLKSNKKILNGDLKLKGKLSYGIGARVYYGVGLYKWEVARMKYIYLDAHSKLEASTEVNLSDIGDSSPLYSALNNANFNLSAKGGLYIERKGFFRLFGKKQSNSSTISDIIERSVSINIGTLHIIPQVNDGKINISGTTATATFKYSRSLLLPVRCGLVLYSDGKEMTSSYQPTSYWLANSNETYTCKFENLKKGTYFLSPSYKLLGATINSDEKYVFSIGNDPENSDIKGIDLGLSVIWGDRNLAATSPIAIGKLYGLGNTLDNIIQYLRQGDDSKFQEEFIAVNARMANYFGLSEQPLGKKYLVNINGTPFAPKELPSGWRVPTLDELIELKRHTTVEETNSGGVHGYTFTGDNGNSMFVPSTGMWHTLPEYSNTLKMMGGTGILVSSEYGWFSYASTITIPSVQNHDEVYYWNGWLGCIRPVKDK